MSEWSWYIRNFLAGVGIGLTANAVAGDWSHGNWWGVVAGLLLVWYCAIWHEAYGE